MMKDKKSVAMIGAGSWGTALSLVLGDNGHTVRLWGKDEKNIAEINSLHQNSKYLPGITLPNEVVGTTSLEQCIQEADIIVLAIPTKAMREVIPQMLPYIKEQKTFVHVSKGIEPGTLMRISEIMEEEIPESMRKSIVVLSGPSHAEEVSLRHPTTVTVSSKNMDEAELVQDLFINHNFRVYTNPDLIGVEIGGALKNIIAVCAGIADGLGFGDNAKAALITRGLAEMARLGTRMGANPLTFAGLTGIGDLIVTCTSVHSRNWRAGNMLGKGHALEEVLDQMGMVVEGIRTTKAAHQLSEKYGVTMPITNALFQILFNGQDAKAAVESLMARGKTNEMEDLINILASQYIE